jgi:iron complex transport system substrate-binding protein
VQFGRGPATVIGLIAVSQATLPSCSGRLFFAREIIARDRPGFLRGFLFSILSQTSSQVRFVQHSHFHAVSRAAFFVLALLSICLAAAAAQAMTAAQTLPPETREVVDEFGRRVRVPLTPLRIVSLAPSLTETLYALGLQDRLVGDTDYCDYPEDARNKHKVGGAINPNLEEIAALHPDLVLVTKAINRLETMRALETLGIPSYATEDPHSVDDIISSTLKLAGVLGAPDAGKLLSDDLQHRLAALQAKLRGVPPSRVLFVVWTEPLISVGKETFIADALRRAGASSIVDSAQNWPQMSLEEVVHLQPDYLVFAASHSEAGAHDFETIANRPGWRILDAVHNRHFAVISDAVNRPAPRIVSAIEDLARQLHPLVFQDSTGPEKPATPPASDGPAPPRMTSIAPSQPHSTPTLESLCAL